MANKRFGTQIRKRDSQVLPFAAYITDRLTSAKFSKTMETRAQCEEWLEYAKRLLTKLRPE